MVNAFNSQSHMGFELVFPFYPTAPLVLVIYSKKAYIAFLDIHLHMCMSRVRA